MKKVEGKWLISRRWVIDERLPGNPDFDVATADPDIAELVQPLLDAYQKLGEKI